MMQQKTNSLKYIKMIKQIALFVLLVAVAPKHIQAQSKIKIDGVTVVVGKNVVLDSDIEKFKEEVLTKSEGKIQLSDCEMLEEIMIQKLLAHHAVVDSIVVADEEVTAAVNRNMNYFKQQLGSIDKAVELYGFNDEADLRKELKKIERDNLLINREKQAITSAVTLTPEEVRVYYKSLEDKGNLPEFGTEIELAQIVMHIEPSQAEIDATIEKLNEIRENILNGSSMRMKAIIYSEDPGVSQNGGQYTLRRDSQFVREFKENAFSLEEGEISEPFKSQFGYHIIMLEKVKGQELDVRHILMTPKVSYEREALVKEKLNRVRDSIQAGLLSFDVAVLKYSEDAVTRSNGGVMINQQTNDSKFEQTRMDPTLYARVNTLAVNDITTPFYEETRDGKKMFKLIMMKDKIPAHTADFVKDYVKIQSLTLQTKQDEILSEWTAKHIEDTYIKINDEYKSCDFKYNWLKNND